MVVAASQKEQKLQGRRKGVIAGMEKEKEVIGVNPRLLVFWKGMNRELEPEGKPRASAESMEILERKQRRLGLACCPPLGSDRRIGDLGEVPRE